MRETTVTPEWRGEVKRRMEVMGLNYRTLAQMTGYSYSAIRQYMCGSYHNDKPRAHIEHVLGMG